MSKKEELLKVYNELKAKDEIECVTLFIHMPTGETESIVNPNVEEKINYICKVYDDNLVHSNGAIYIEDYVFSMKNDEMDFSAALEEIKEGKKVARKGWNGKGLWVACEKMYTHTPLLVQDIESTFSHPVLLIKNADDHFATWVPSITDLFAEDWVVVE